MCKPWTEYNYINCEETDCREQDEQLLTLNINMQKYNRA